MKLMSSKKIKIVTVVGTRPEIIRLSSIIKRLNESNSFEHYLVHTGQNYDYELNEIFFNDLKIPKPNNFLDSAKDSPSKTIGNILINLDDVLDKIKPEALLILGDTNSCLSAIVAKKKKIPIFHFEAGNRCFDQRVPEEINRKIVDRIIKIGSPMLEVIEENKKYIDKSNILTKLKLKQNSYFLISCHREENVDNKLNLKYLIESINFLAKKYNMPIIFPMHPRTSKRIKESNLILTELVQIISPLGFSDYCKLQMNSYIVLSDSGTIFEESSILNFRALNLRESHERPEAIEESSVVISGLNKERIIHGIEILKSQTIGRKRNLNIVGDYNIKNVSLKVERILLSYIDYVNRVVWQKES